MKLKSTITVIILTFLFIANINAKHITGGYIGYTVLSNNGSSFSVDVSLSMFRDPTGGGGDFDNDLRLGVYRVLPNGELEFISMFVDDPTEVLDIESDILNCRGTIAEYELGRYNMIIEIPNDGSDYQIAYQRCCRSNSLLGVIDVKSSGMLFTTRINYESLTSLNSSPILTDTDNRFFTVNELHDLEMSFIDIDGDEIVITPATPYEVGGIDGSGSGPGDANSCTGVTPDPNSCIPMFNTISYSSGYSLEFPLGPNGTFLNDGNGGFSFSSSSMGMYLFGFKVEEFRGGELMTTAHYETTVILSLAEANNVFGQLYLDENANGIYDTGEAPFTITPDVLNDYCNFHVDENQSYSLDLEDDVANFQNIADNYIFTNGMNEISSPSLCLTEDKEFNIGFVPLGDRGIEDVSIDVFSGLTLCHKESQFFIELENVGTVTTSGNLVLSNIQNMTFLDCDCDFEIDGEDVIIEVGEIDPLEKLSFTLSAINNDETSVGEPVTVLVEFYAADDTEALESATFDDVVLCSFDPNDISVTPTRLPNYIVEQDERMVVKIRFENLGNYYASKVSIDQLLDINLDAATIKVLEASHPYTMMKSRNDLVQELRFIFDDIELPGTNSPVQSEREGFIIYAIDMKEGMNIGTLIDHSAEIVFDLNKPIITNTITNVVGTLDGDFIYGSDNSKPIVTVFPNPAQEVIYIAAESKFERYFISNAAQKYLKEGDMANKVNISDLIPGIYMITFVAENGFRVSRKIVKTFSF